VQVVVKILDLSSLNTGIRHLIYVLNGIVLYCGIIMKQNGQKFTVKKNQLISSICSGCAGAGKGTGNGTLIRTGMADIKTSDLYHNLKNDKRVDAATLPTMKFDILLNHGSQPVSV